MKKFTGATLLFSVLMLFLSDLPESPVKDEDVVAYNNRNLWPYEKIMEIHDREQQLTPPGFERIDQTIRK